CWIVSSLPSSQWPALLHLLLLVRDHAADGGTLEHAVLVCGVVLKFSHRQLAAHAPGVKDEPVWIEHRIAVREPFAAGEYPVDLFQIGVEGLKPHVLDARKRRSIGGIAF